MAKSLQDHLREKRSSTFVGREQYLELFKQNLSRALDSEDYYFIFSIHGQGGVGKTTLINKFQELAKEHEALVTYTNEDIREIPELLGTLAKQFREQGAPLKKLEDRYRIYLQEKKRLEADPEAPKSTWSVGGKMLAKGGKELAKSLIPGSGLVLDHINTDVIGEQIGEWGSFLKKKIGNKDEVELLLSPVKVLTPIFLEDLNELANRSKICLFFDTYENTDIYLDEWLHQLLEGRFGEAPENALITIAGREPLNPNHWVDFAGFISSISLEPFSEIEARNYLAGKKITDSATIDTIIQLSGRLPVLLEILAEKAPNSPGDVNDRCETAVERFLKWIEDPVLRNLALHAALPNLLNEDIVKRLLPEGVELTKLFDWLRSNPFVYKRDDHWAYHTLVRDLMIRYQRQLSLETWEKLNIKLAEYYLERANILGLETGAQWKDSTWVGWIIEHHYHQLLVAPKNAIAEAMRAFAKVFRLNGFSSAIPWSEIIVQTEQITQNPKYGLVLRKGLAAWQSDKYHDAIQMFSLININRWLVDIDDISVFHFYEAYCNRRIGQVFKAIEQFQKVIELEPNYFPAYYNLGLALKSSNDLPGATTQFQKIIELKPDFALAYHNLGDVLQASNDLPGAIEQYKKAIELKLDQAFVHVGLGMALQASNDLTGAIEQFQKAIELDPMDFLPCLGLGLILQASNDLPGAIIQFRKAINLNQNDSYAYYSLGLALQDSNDLTGAIAQYQNAIKVEPGFALAYHNLGTVLQASNDLPGAIVQFQKAIKLNPDYALAYHNLGIVLQSSNDVPGAITQFQKAIELDPNYALTYYNLGVSLQASNDLPGAIYQYQKAIELMPDFAPGHIMLGNALQDLNDLPRVIIQFQKVIELMPDFALAYNNLGKALQDSNDLPGAVTQFQKAIELKPDFIDFIHNNLGNALQELNDLPGAITQFQKAVELNPNYARAWHNLGWIQLLTHQLPLAEISLINAWKLWSETDSLPAMNLGHVELFKSNQATAIEWYKKSIELNENKEDFFEQMESDFTDLQMETHGINRELYDSILSELRTI